MEYYDFKVLTHVYGSLWQNLHVYTGVPHVNRDETGKAGEYTWQQVDTPESWHTVCLILVGIPKTIKSYEDLERKATKVSVS